MPFSMALDSSKVRNTSEKKVLLYRLIGKTTFEILTIS